MEGFISSHYNPDKILSLIKKENKVFELKNNLYFCFDGNKNLKYIFYMYETKIRARKDILNNSCEYRYWLILVSNDQVEIIVDGFYLKEQNSNQEINRYKETVYVLSQGSLVGFWDRQKRDQYSQVHSSSYDKF